MSKPRVYVTRSIPQEGLDIVDQNFDYEIWDHDQPVPADLLAEKIKDVDGVYTLLTEQFTPELMASANNLKVISNMAVGFDNIDVEAATKLGIVVTNTPGVLTETTADLTFALLMATARRLGYSERRLRDGLWETWKPMEFTGQDIYGATLGLVGMGRIGAAVARRALGFNMRVIYTDAFRKPEVESALFCEYKEFDEVLQEADFISLHTPLLPETRHLISDREFKLMKPTAILVNTSRGPVIDPEALEKALRDGEIWAAGLDVFEVEPISSDNPLIKLDNIVTLPHVGSASIRTRIRMAQLTANNLVAVLNGKEALTPVNNLVARRTRKALNR
jgi:glyoxylate reductase